MAWGRLVSSAIVRCRLRGYWGQLGQYCPIWPREDVKARIARDVVRRRGLGQGFKLIASSPENSFHRMVVGIIALSRLRGFWGQLGQYLEDAKSMGSLVTN
eukprot:8371569-Pyramimonas_sp.AAC.1